MAIRKTKPDQPRPRFGTYQLREELTAEPTKKPDRGQEALRRPQLRRARHRRHRGGGAKRRYRKSTSSAPRTGCPEGRDDRVRPEPPGDIALLNYADGEKRYILAPQRLGVGAKVESGDGADIPPGNSLPLNQIPTGTVVHNVEITPGRGARLGRAAGAAIQVVAKEGQMVSLRLPSSEVRMVRGECRATVGALSKRSTRTSRAAAPAATAAGKRPRPAASQ